MNQLGAIDHFIREIDSASGIEQITIALRKQIDLLGFEKFSYQLLKSTEGPRPEFYITGYPRGWDARYSEKRYASHDMVLRHAARVIRPFSWLEIGRFNDFTPEQKIVFKEAEDFRIETGGTVPIHGPGLAKAQFTVASDLSKNEFEKLFAERRHEVHLVATYLHERLFKLGLLGIQPATMKLTPRELEVLTWSARGKTKWAISEILAISETTVKTHINSACRKLNTLNKTHAASVAIMHGLIIP